MGGRPPGTPLTVAPLAFALPLSTAGVATFALAFTTPAGAPSRGGVPCGRRVGGPIGGVAAGRGRLARARMLRGGTLAAGGLAGFTPPTPAPFATVTTGRGLVAGSGVGGWVPPRRGRALAPPVAIPFATGVAITGSGRRPWRGGGVLGLGCRRTAFVPARRPRGLGSRSSRWLSARLTFVVAGLAGPPASRTLCSRGSGAFGDSITRRGPLGRRRWSLRLGVRHGSVRGGLVGASCQRRFRRGSPFGDTKRHRRGTALGGRGSSRAGLFGVVDLAERSRKLGLDSRGPGRSRGHNSEAPRPWEGHQVKDRLVAQKAPQSPLARRSKAEGADGLRSKRNRRLECVSITVGHRAPESKLSCRIPMPLVNVTKLGVGGNQHNGINKGAGRPQLVRDRCTLEDGQVRSGGKP